MRTCDKGTFPWFVRKRLKGRLEPEHDGTSAPFSGHRPHPSPTRTHHGDFFPAGSASSASPAGLEGPAGSPSDRHAAERGRRGGVSRARAVRAAHLDRHDRDHGGTPVRPATARCPALREPARSRGRRGPRGAQAGPRPPGRRLRRPWRCVRTDGGRGAVSLGGGAMATSDAGRPRRGAAAVGPAGRRDGGPSRRG
ncbi:hypothetical protein CAUPRSCDRAFT_11752 [Caulochytrium protostelioides]|uniref:Uncharacterized protein n=1 Tax=Caulochytrium protostelioides TaxID=1555241 RepID=A0A4P9WZ08_9FUNG|nr:hypothetical protein CAUPRSCDRAFT_11752 [Caulochytrium protostelioides]